MHAWWSSWYEIHYADAVSVQFSILDSAEVLLALLFFITFCSIDQSHILITSWSFQDLFKRCWWWSSCVKQVCIRKKLSFIVWLKECIDWNLLEWLAAKSYEHKQYEYVLSDSAQKSWIFDVCHHEKSLNLFIKNVRSQFQRLIY